MEKSRLFAEDDKTSQGMERDFGGLSSQAACPGQHQLEKGNQAGNVY